MRARSREGRALVRSRAEFEAVLVRGAPVRHRLHFVGSIGAAGIGALAGRALFDIQTGLLLALLGGGAWGLYWLFLALTGGEELDRLSVDEQGLVHSDISGHSPEARGDALKIGIPTIAIAFSLYLVGTLGHDLVFPPAPRCNTSPPPPGACLLLPNLGDALAGAAASHSPSGGPSPSASPNGSASPGANSGSAGKTAGVPLTVDQAIALERIVRGFQLLIAGVVLLASVWFLRRMLTGRPVLWAEPVRGRSPD